MLTFLRRNAPSITLAVALSVAVPVFATAQEADAGVADVVAPPVPGPVVNPYPGDPRYIEPTGVDDASADALFLLKLAKAKYWVGAALVFTQLLVFAAKRLGGTSGKFKQYGTITVTVASAGAGLLSMVVGGQTWGTAALIFMGTIAPKLLADLFTELGVTPHREDPPADPPAPAPAPQG